MFTVENSERMMYGLRKKIIYTMLTAAVLFSAAAGIGAKFYREVEAKKIKDNKSESIRSVRSISEGAVDKKETDGGYVSIKDNNSIQNSDTASKNNVVNQTAVAETENNVQSSDASKKSEVSQNKNIIYKQEENTKTENKEKGIPVLMYHSVDYEKGNELRIPKEKLREQMQYLKDNGYTTLTLEQLYNHFVNNAPIPEKSVVLTFDDGYADNYTNAFPVLKEFGFKAAIFVITKTVDTDSSYLTSNMIKEMSDYGIDIESHTVNHDELNKLSYEEQCKTLKDSKGFLEKITDKEVKYIAYPFGKYNGDTLKAAKECGYTMAVTTRGAWSNKSDGLLTLNRVYISSIAGMEDFKIRITNRNYNKK